MDQLPEEVIDLVCEALSRDTPSLHNVCLVSRKHRRIAEPHLWSKIKSTKLECLIETLENRADLQCEVVSLTIRPVVRRPRLLHSRWQVPGQLGQLTLLMPKLETLIIDNPIGVVSPEGLHRLLQSCRQPLASSLRRLDLFIKATRQQQGPTTYGVSVDAGDAGFISRTEVWKLLRSSKLERLRLDANVLADHNRNPSAFSDIERLPTLPLPANLRYLHIRYVRIVKVATTSEVKDFSLFAAQLKAHLPDLRRIYIELINFPNHEDVVCRFHEAFTAVGIDLDSNLEERACQLH
ncbi:hypothetical protein BDV96DRAFT_349131 [Lophiotrema nucula]|uniref:F-box domain-containing protein n=1 Tax=Lophiotrema nucula TaxID=690887 RepID=A0A6A5ZKP4_9PLEO|nr:hypothetical protein BDV96DRAFT_349131 [Lophiotrema nucula]